MSDTTRQQHAAAVEQDSKDKGYFRVMVMNVILYNDDDDDDMK
jgi:hypothetical protein